MQTVASAATQLDESVQAVTSQLSDATAIVQRASSMAEAANQTIGRLASAAQQIDEVVGFIRTIAGQTNLLALNVTIEAARAGEAGRGLAGAVGGEERLLSSTIDPVPAAWTDRRRLNDPGAPGVFSTRLQRSLLFQSLLSPQVRPENICG